METKEWVATVADDFKILEIRYLKSKPVRKPLD